MVVILTRHRSTSSRRDPFPHIQCMGPTWERRAQAHRGTTWSQELNQGEIMKMSLKYALHDCTNTYEYINHRIQLLSCTCGLTDPAPVPHGVDLWCPILLGGLIACGFPLFRPERGKCVSGNEGISPDSKYPHFIGKWWWTIVFRTLGASGLHSGYTLAFSQTKPCGELLWVQRPTPNTVNIERFLWPGQARALASATGLRGLRFGCRAHST